MRLFWIALTYVFSLAAGANVPLTEVLGNGPPIPAAPELKASGYLLIDATNGEVLVEHNADQPLPPASLTKMMTAYIAEREIAEGRASLRIKYLLVSKRGRLAVRECLFVKGQRFGWRIFCEESSFSQGMMQVSP